MLKGFRCPAWGEEPGRDNKISYCVRKCTRPCVAPHILAAMLNEEKKNPHKGKMISVTMLTGGCKRQTTLERAIDFYVEPDRKLPTFRGTLIHSIVDKSKTKEIIKAGWLIEHHMELPVKTKSGEWTLSGTADSIDRTNRILYDIKTLQEYAVEKLIKGTNAGTWSNHIPDQYVKQLNLYRYLGAKTDSFEVDTLKLQLIAFGKMILTGTTIEHRVRVGRYYETQEFTIPDIPILEDSLVESWIHKEGDEWYNILFNNEVAPVCSEDWSWLCKSCVFYGTKHCPDPEFERELL